MSAAAGKPSSPNRTTWKIMATTPMRDIVRGRPTCRLDLTIYPERAGLPRALADVVVRTASKTHLRAREKADVARELSAHFAEGITSGKTTDDLIESFGDIKQAAKLIRRSKKRNRSRVLRTMKRTTAVTFTIIALLYTGVLIWYVAGSGKVNPSHDYLADMNAVAAAVPEQDRAWPVYREAFISLGSLPENVRDCAGPADYRWPETIAYIESHQPELDQFRQAAAMPGLGYITDVRHHPEDLPLVDPESKWYRDPDDEDMTMVIPTLYSLLPQINYLRHAARLLQFNILHSLETEATEGTIEDIATIVRIARQSNEHETYITQLVRTSIYTFAMDTTKTVLLRAGGQLTDAQLEKLGRLYDPQISGNLCAVSHERERMLLRDVEQHLYTDNGHGNGRIHPEMMADAWSGPSSQYTPLLIAAPTSALMPDRKSFRAMTDEFYDAAERELAKPMWTRDISEMQRLIDRIEQSQWEKIRWSFLLMMAPAVDRIFANADITAIQRDALITAIALHRYQRAENRWPATLVELIPDYLDTIPIDRFDGKPLRYILDDNGEPILYSVGANLEDNGGIIDLDEEGHPSNIRTQHWIPPSQLARARTEQEAETGFMYYVNGRRPSKEHQQWRRGIPDADFILWPPLPEKPIEPDPDDDEY